MLPLRLPACSGILLIALGASVVGCDGTDVEPPHGRQGLVDAADDVQQPSPPAVAGKLEEVGPEWVYIGEFETAEQAGSLADQQSELGYAAGEDEPDAEADQFENSIVWFQKSSKSAWRLDYSEEQLELAAQ